MKQIEMNIPDNCYTMIDCWDAIMVMMLTYFNKRPEITFAGTDFYYNFPDEVNKNMTLTEIFSRTIGLYNEAIILEKFQFYEDFLGLRVQALERGTMTTFLENIEFEIDSNRPIVIFLDTFNCKFNAMYQKFHFFHGAIIAGIDENQLLVHDPTQHLELIKVDIEDVYKSTAKLVKFESLNVYDEIETESMFRHSFFKGYIDKTFRKGTKLENLHRFVEDFTFNREEVFRSMESSEESLSIMIAWVFKNTATRYKYFVSFLKMQYESSKINGISALMDLVGDKWKFLGRLYMKMYYITPEARIEAFDKLARIMNEILVIENSIFDYLCQLLNVKREDWRDSNAKYIPVAGVYSK